MQRGNLYVLFFVAIFAAPVLGLLMTNWIWLIAGFIAALCIGIVADRFDNKNDEPYKKYNQLHHHH